LIYTLLLTFYLGAGDPVVKAQPCPDLTCVAYVMVAATESPALSRIRVFRGKPGLLSSGMTRFPPMLDYWYH